LALGLPEAVLDNHGIGFMAQGPHKDESGSPLGHCWTFPEQDGRGAIVGISCRYADVQKKAMAGGLRGLFIPSGWEKLRGPICFPEGPSDVLTFTAMGLPAIGRPNNAGGASHLAELLKDEPSDSQLVILGEYDAKPDGRWPGRDGARKCAEELAAKLDRPVSMAFPPEQQKDVRKWALSQNPDVASLDEWQDLGEKFLAGLQYFEIKPAETAKGFRFDVIDSATFFSRDYRQSWLVERLLVQGQPCIVGGPKKTLKTSFLVALAVALSSGTPFLGRFRVCRRLRVALLSGESGEFTLQETGLRICRALDIDPLSLNIVWGFKLPSLANAEQVAALRQGLRERGIEVVIIDPAYLCLLAGATGREIEAGNLFHMGPLLMTISQACLSVGCTPLLVFHCRKAVAANPQDGIELDDLAFSGIAEFARQWLLFSRREKYQPGTGSHRLWLSAGGSIGHGGRWALDVEEGTIDENFAGRKWEVSVAPMSEALEMDAARRNGKRQDELKAKDKRNAAALLVALDSLDPGANGVGFRKTQDMAHLGPTAMGRAVASLVDEGIIEVIPDLEVDLGSNAKRKVKGIRRKTHGD
jgi:hypothetical protein